ncbi:hypothetical protein CEXT_685721 [Caerostris extrusa]|uniref:Uncharacterized protein n=1 Tax=Caerostris extrusa TaxID=172846 RepID=A0AAV4VRS8_CAEEX|nr:hypothetical protein CEXT_685721 [Caerostris extrusa]
MSWMGLIYDSAVNCMSLDIRCGHILRPVMEGPSPATPREHVLRIQASGSVLAAGHMEAGLLLQERESCHLSDHDHSEPLRMDLQGQDDTLHGQVRNLYPY